MDLSIIVPAYNEQWRILPTLLEIIDYLDSRSITYEIIVVNDGSKDTTKNILERLKKIKPEILINNFPKNRGKGAAVRAGMLSAKGVLHLFVDADGATPIRELERLMHPLNEGFDLAIGSRAIPSNDTKVSTIIHRKLLGRIFNRFVSFFLLPKISDSQCGFKLFTAEASKSLFSLQKLDGFSFDVEILYIARKLGLKTAEVAVNWTNIPGSKVNVIIDGIRMLRDLIKIRYFHRNITPLARNL